MQNDDMPSPLAGLAATLMLHARTLNRIAAIAMRAGKRHKLNIGDAARAQSMLIDATHDIMLLATNLGRMRDELERTPGGRRVLKTCRIEEQLFEAAEAIERDRVRLLELLEGEATPQIYDIAPKKRSPAKTARSA